MDFDLTLKSFYKLFIFINMDSSDKFSIQNTQIEEEETRMGADEVCQWGSIHTNNPKMPNYEISEDEILIGRRPTCNVVVQDKRISSVHCRIFLPPAIKEKDSAIIEDLRFSDLLMLPMSLLLLYIIFGFIVQMEHM